MFKTRYQKAMVSSMTSLAYQFVSVICGLIVPRLLISTFGDETYGATTSITQFLSYIALIEGGIGGVGRAALYNPLAHKDIAHISKIYVTLKDFFRRVGVAFIAYTIVIGVVYHDIAGITAWSRLFTLLLVFAISISTIGQYFIGISNVTLINAAQKHYINNIASIVVTILNTIAVVILINLGCNILCVKFISSCVYIIKPFVLNRYVKIKFELTENEKADLNILSQRWTGIGQHIAFFLHTNTDVILLTLFSNLKMVSVYSVYYMVSSNIQRITRSFSSGMEAVYGDMISKKENVQLYKAYTYYDNFTSTITIILFSTTVVMIMPFISIYTAKFEGVSYVYPVFAVLLLMAEAIECFSIPYYNLAIAANHFAKTKYGAYGEAVINIVVSLCLVRIFPLEGVAVGTLAAVIFKILYYAIYGAKNILGTKISKVLTRIIINIIIIMINAVIGLYIIKPMSIDLLVKWIGSSMIVFGVVSISTVILKFMLFTKEYTIFLEKMLKKDEAF